MAAPDQLWLADISCIRTWEGWLYLAVILDAYSRKVIGWAFADHLRTELATAAFQMALRNRRPRRGVIHHSDRGVQYVSAAYTHLLSLDGLRHRLDDQVHAGTMRSPSVSLRCSRTS